MKRCPQCARSYDDETLNFCLDDGEWLIGETDQTEQTAILPGKDIVGEATARLVGPTTDRSAATAVSRRNHWFSGKAMLAILIPVVLLISGFVTYRYFLNTGGGDIDSIAVMPFENVSGNAEIDYLSDGITESLINSLSRIPDLAVKARSSVFTYKGKNVSPQQVARELSVEAVLNGRVLERGDEITLSLELMDAATGNQIWGEQYVRKVSNLANLQSQIARDVSVKLHAKLTTPEQQNVAKNFTQDPEAYQLYLRGKYHWNRRTPTDIRKSIEYFQQAIEKDPGYALSYAGLAEAYILLPAYVNEPPQNAYPRARSAAMRSLEIDDSLAEAHAVLATVACDYEWNFTESEAGFRRAIELNPNYATGHQWYGEFLLSMGRYPEALTELKRAHEADPLSLIINGLLGVAYRLNGDFDAAIAQINRTIDMDPNFARAHLFRSEIYQDAGRYEEAADEFAVVARLNGMPPETVNMALTSIKEAYRRGGPKAYHRRFAELLENAGANNPPAPPTIRAKQWVKAGDNEKAIEILRGGLRERDPSMLRAGERAFAPLRADPRYQEIMREIGLPLPEWSL